MPRYKDPIRQQLLHDRLSKSHKGKLLGDLNPSKRIEVRQKISKKLKGRNAPWMSLMNKDPLIKEKQHKNNKGHFGNKPPWNKGLIVDRNEYPKMGHMIPHTEKGKINIKNGLPDNFSDICRETALKNIAEGKWKKTFNTRPEREFKEILLELNLIEKFDFLHQKRVGNYMFDFYLIRQNIIIEVDGCRWHSLPEIQKKDKIKERYLKDNNIKLLRFWDYEIYNEKEKIKNIIKSLIIS